MENKRYKQLSSIDLQARRRLVLAFADKPSPSSVLVKAMHTPQATIASAPTVTHWLGSGKNLDFCMLAVCSCVLAILCHQTVHLPISTSSASQLATSSRVFPSQLDFIIKAGLFTSSNSQSEQDEEINE